MVIALAKIYPDFMNFFLSTVIAVPVHAAIVILSCSLFGTLVPCQSLINAVTYIVVLDFVFSLKVIPIRNADTGRIKRWNIGSWINLPSSTRFDLKTRHRYRKTLTTTLILWFLFTSYLILSSVFNAQGVVVQALMVPLFFGFRCLYEMVCLNGLSLSLFLSLSLPFFRRTHTHTHTHTYSHTY
jgi:hypothetical protein